MPKYGCINERRNQLHEVIRLSGMNIIIDDNDHPLIIKVATLQPTRMQVYFFYNDDYFTHGGTKELETVSSPTDNDERSIFFVRGSLETVKKLRWIPELVQLRKCSDLFPNGQRPGEYWRLGGCDFVSINIKVSKFGTLSP